VTITDPFIDVFNAGIGSGLQMDFQTLQSAVPAVAWRFDQIWLEGTSEQAIDLAPIKHLFTAVAARHVVSELVDGDCYVLFGEIVDRNGRIYPYQVAGPAACAPAGTPVAPTEYEVPVDPMDLLQCDSCQ